jgi:hypothetical protein
MVLNFNFTKMEEVFVNAEPVLKKLKNNDNTHEELLKYQEQRWKSMLSYTTKGTIPPNLNLDTECLLWIGQKDLGGYGRIRYKKHIWSAHRVSWMISNKIEIVPKTNATGEVLIIRHLCNTPCCVEPSHLMLGTNAENAEDKVTNPNNLSKGETHHSAKITKEMAQKIKLSVGKGTKRERAEEFGVPLTIVRDIDAGNSWAYLPDINGNTTKRANRSRKALKILREKNSNVQWTVEQWQKVKDKLTNPDYVKVSETKFFDDVPCVEWIRTIQYGYGTTSIFGVHHSVHVLACTIANNYIKVKGKDAAHKCGNSICVEPKHLYFATKSQNAVDALNHGKKCKLTASQVLEIRKSHLSGISQTQLAKQYNVSKEHIFFIVHRKSWKHI